jgi:hypothetical protein
MIKKIEQIIFEFIELKLLILKQQQQQQNLN